jgi:uncharacterized protein (DUF2141 family)
MFIAALALAAAGAGTLTVAVGNVRNDRGMIHIDVCDEAHFLKSDCQYWGEAPAHPGTVTVTVKGLPAGNWGIQAYHDENRNRDVDRNFLGIPKEGIGFSRDARIGLGPPKWRDAVFGFDGQGAATGLRLHYMLGPSGPPAR